MEAPVLWRKIVITSLVRILFLAGSFTFAGAQIGRGFGSFGGELRGLTRVKGKVLCIECTLDRAKDANPDLSAKLYEFTNNNQLAVFQLLGVGEVGGIQDASDLSYWMTVTGMNKQLSLRLPEKLWTRLTAEENLAKEVELTGILRNTNTFDVAQVTYPE